MGTKAVSKTVRCNVWDIRVGLAPDAPIRQFPCFTMDRGGVCVRDRDRFWIQWDRDGQAFIDPAKPIPYIEPTEKYARAG